MILYCAVLPIMLFSMVLHKMNKHKNQDAVILVDKHVYETRNLIDCINNLVNAGIFKSAVVIDTLAQRKQNETDEQYEINLMRYFDKMLYDNGFQLSDFEKIYTNNDTWKAEINLYFNLKKIRYTWIEITKDTLLENYYPNALAKKYSYFSPFSVYAFPEILSTSDSSQAKLKKSSREYSTWDKIESIKNLSLEEIEALIHCFHIEINDDFDKSCLLVLNSFGFSSTGTPKNDRIKQLIGETSYPVQDFFKVMSQFALDFYVQPDTKVYIKTHPHDPIELSDVKKYFGSNACLFTDAPFEFVIEYFIRKKIKFDKIIGYKSTSLEMLTNDLYNDAHILGVDYIKTWFYYSSIWICLKLLSELNADNVYSHAYIISQLKNLSKIYDLKSSLYDLDQNNRSINFKNSFVIIDMISQNYIGGLYPQLCNIDPSDTIIFINCDLSDGFFEKQYLPYFTNIKIEKECLNNKVIDIHREENIWIYSKNMKIHQQARQFNVVKELHRSGVVIKVKNNVLDNSIKEFQRKYIDTKIINEIQSLFDKNRNLYNRLNNVYEFALRMSFRDGDLTSASKLLKDIDDFSFYVKMLKVIMPQTLIIMSVKDTPGSLMPDDILNELHRIGFSALTRDLWRMYVGVIYNEVEVFNKSSESNEQSVIFVYAKNDLKLAVESHSWKGQNVAKIVVNNVDYSANMRGLNIVVVDSATGTVLDSVAYDSHYEIKKFVHKLL